MLSDTDQTLLESRRATAAKARHGSIKTVIAGVVLITIGLALAGSPISYFAYPAGMIGILFTGVHCANYVEARIGIKSLEKKSYANDLLLQAQTAELHRELDSKDL